MTSRLLTLLVTSTSCFTAFALHTGDTIEMGVVLTVMGIIFVIALVSIWYFTKSDVGVDEAASSFRPHPELARFSNFEKTISGSRSRPHLLKR